MNINSIFQSVGSFLSGVFESILSLLPDSPFAAIVSNPEVSKYLGWLNWVLPITEVLAVMQAWLVSIGIYYAWSILLRWIKAVD